MGDFTHLKKGKAVMVDVTQKTPSERIAKSKAHVQTGSINLKKELSQKAQQELALTIRLSAIQAAKKTSELIPLCHPLSLSFVECEVEFKENKILIICTAKTKNTTGVEMEAMVGASIGALTAYDMIKSKCRDTSIEKIQLVYKEGGKSGVWKRT